MPNPHNDPQEPTAYRELHPRPDRVYDITGHPASPMELAHQERVHTLLQAEQMVLAMRAQQAAQTVAVPPGQTILPASAVYQPVPAKAKTYALVVGSTGGAVAAGGWGLAQAAPALASLARLGASAAAIATAAIVAFLLLRFTGGGHSGSEGTEVHFHRGSKARIRIRNVNIR